MSKFSQMSLTIMFSVLMVSCICNGAVINVDGLAAGNMKN